MEEITPGSKKYIPMMETDISIISKKKNKKLIIDAKYYKNAMETNRFGVKKINSHNLNNIEFIEGSVLDLPFEKQTFDFVYCKGVLHHTGDLNKGVEELYRVLKNNGMAFLYLYGSGGLFWYSRFISWSSY